jgi:O-antigen/teichoic acid export membrane protein
MSASRVTRGFAWNHLYKMVEYGGVNLYAILVMRKFGPELGGNYAVYLSITGTLGILAAFAVDGALLRYLPRIARGDSERGSPLNGRDGGMKVGAVRPFIIQMFAFRMLVTLVLSAIVVLVLGVLPLFVPALATSLGTIRLLWPYFVVFLLGQCIVAFSAFTMIGLLQVKWVFYASLLTRVSLLAIFLVLIVLGGLSIEWAVALHAFAALVNGIVLLYWVNRHVEHASSPGLRTEFTHFVRHLSDFTRKPGYLRVFVVLPFMLYGITTWGSDVLTTILGRQPDILMMRAMLGENARDIGLYEAAARLVLMTEYLFLFGLGGTLVSVFSELVHQDESEHVPARTRLVRAGGPDHGTRNGPRFPRLAKARRDISGFQSVSTAPLIAFMIAFAPLVTSVVYGPKFSGALPMVMAGLSVLAITVIGFGGGMQVTSLVVIGKERVVFANRLAWGILNLIANYFLIRRWGGLGAMIGTQVSNSAACITESFLARKWIGPSFNPRRTASIVAIVAASTGLSYLVAIDLLPEDVPQLLRLLIAGGVMATATLAGYKVFRIPDAQKVLDKMRSLRGKTPAAVLPIE